VRVVIFSLNDENIEIQFENFTHQINKINELLCVLINTQESLQIYKSEMHSFDTRPSPAGRSRTRPIQG